MSKIEIEADVPDGWVAVAYRPPLKGELYLDHRGRIETAAYDFVMPWLILRRVEPKKESRWALLHKSPGYWVLGSFFEDRMYPASEATGPHRRLLRFDLEDDCIVSVALESVEGKE